MAKLTKRQKAIAEKIQAGKQYGFEDAAKLLAELSTIKFKESVDVAINLGVDPRKSDQVVRGATVLPNGTGKSVRVAVFTQGPAAEAALAAGADRVGMDELAAEMKGGDLNYDVVIASPDAMRVVGQLGQILGPRGLMPNPKVGTVTPDVATAVKNAKAGQVRFRTDKNGIIHASVGKVDFEPAKLKQNVEALLSDLKRLKPSASKGVYVKRVTLSTTMGPGLQVDQASLDAHLAQPAIAAQAGQRGIERGAQAFQLAQPLIGVATGGLGQQLLVGLDVHDHRFGVIVVGDHQRLLLADGPHQAGPAAGFHRGGSGLLKAGQIQWQGHGTLQDGMCPLYPFWPNWT